MLDGTARTSLGDDFTSTLLVQATVDLSPADLAGVNALKEVRLGLAVDETEGLKLAKTTLCESY